MIVNDVNFTVYVRVLVLKLDFTFDGGELQQTLDKGTFKIHSYNTSNQQNH